MPVGFWIALVCQALILVAAFALRDRFLERSLGREEEQS